MNRVSGWICLGLLMFLANAAMAEGSEPRKGRYYSVEIEGNTFSGPKDALVTLVVLVDYACPFSRKLGRETLTELRAKIPDVKVVRKLLPLHPKARGASVAACVAGQQGLLDEAEAAIWEHGWIVAPGDEHPLPTGIQGAALTKALRKVPVDLEKAEKSKKACRNQVRKDLAWGEKFGIMGTPSMFVNGKPVYGAVPFVVLAEHVDRERAVAERAVRAGVPADQYYRLHIQSARGPDLAAGGQHDAQ